MVVPNGARWTIFRHEQTEREREIGDRRQLLVVALRERDVHPELDAAGCMAHGVADAAEGLLEGLGHADLLRVGARVRPVHAEERAT